MNLTDALEQLEAIHSHLARAEMYRGYRPLALAFTGLLGLAAAVLQPWWVPANDGQAYVLFWSVVAGGCAVLGGGGTLLAYLLRDGPLARRRTRTVVGQFVPCLFAGAVVTLAWLRLGREVDLLPGLWAMLFGLGVVAELPYLPRLTGVVAAWYLGAGVVLLALPQGPVPPGWAVGVPFGVGHLLAALALLRTPHVQPASGEGSGGLNVGPPCFGEGVGENHL